MGRRVGLGLIMSKNFKCYQCDYKTDSEESLNGHSLWKHNSWRGNCENPNKIDSQTEADSIKKRITDIVRWNQHNRTDELIKLLNRLNEMGWAKPSICDTKKAEEFMEKYWRLGYQYGCEYSYSMKGQTTKREAEDKQWDEEQEMAKIIREVDEEIKQKDYVFDSEL